MSKKKNTLNDLEEFLKMQASALVTPAPLGAKSKEQITTPKSELHTADPTPTDLPSSSLATESDLIEAIRKISSANKKSFYDLLIRITENLPNRSKDDALLINTALYLKGGANWKEVVRDYWKKR